MKLVGNLSVGTSPVCNAPGWLRQVSGVGVGEGRVGMGNGVAVGAGEAVGVGGIWSGGAQAGSPVRSARQAKARIA